MSIEEIKTYIFQKFERLMLLSQEYDSTSNLNREGYYRLNVGLDKDTFLPMFAGLTNGWMSLIMAVIAVPLFYKLSSTRKQRALQDVAN